MADTRTRSGQVRKNEGLPISTQILRARLSDAGLIRAAVFALPFFLIAPALWNGYPLLQWDTGGYLARWYEGYLVPSRSTVFGLYLHLGETTYFWINLVLQAILTLWIIQTTLRVLGATRRFAMVAISLLLTLTTALPWLASMLADRHFRRAVGSVAVSAGGAWRAARYV